METNNKWYETAQFYHIYPLGLCGAPKNNTFEGTEYRLKQLEGWIPHLLSLGVNAVYIGPLFESSTHGYDTCDYKKVDSRLGDNDTLAELVRQYHEAGIRVVVDGVFNHTGREFFAFRDLRERRQESRYAGWYKGLDFYGNTHYNDGFGYQGWRGHLELPELNLRNPEVSQYLLEVARWWVETFGIDGIRLDSADVLDFDFMRQLRHLANDVKEDFWLLGEVIHGDYNRWANQEMLHAVTNYEMSKGLYSGHNDYNYFEIAHSAKRAFQDLYRNIRLYNFADNHDVDRLAERLHNPEHIYNVYTLLYTFPGVPAIYYGSEWGIRGRKEGGSDDALRPAVDIRNVAFDNPRLLSHIQKLGAARRGSDALNTGAYGELALTNKQYAFQRFTDRECVLVLLNADNAPCEMSIPLHRIAGGGARFSTLAGEETEVQVRDGGLYVSLKPCSSVVLAVEN